MNLLRFVARRLAHVVPVLIIVTFGATALTDLIPGSPAEFILGPSAAPSAYAQFNQEYGLNKPLFPRYWAWVVNAFHGNLGYSVEGHRPVTSVISAALPVTVELALLAFIIALVLSVALAIIATWRPDGIVDRFITGLSSVLLSVPAYVAAVILLYPLAIRTNLLPPNGWVPISQGLGANLSHAILPAITMTIPILPMFTRVLRADMLAISQEEFVLTARARGLPRWYVTTHHILRPASVSLATVAGLAFALMLAGSIVVETFFALPGLGFTLSQSVSGKDVPTVQGIVVFTATAYLVINLGIDVCTALIDPRVRASGKSVRSRKSRSRLGYGRPSTQTIEAPAQRDVVAR